MAYGCEEVGLRSACRFRLRLRQLRLTMGLGQDVILSRERDEQADSPQDEREGQPGEPLVKVEKRTMLVIHAFGAGEIRDRCERIRSGDQLMDQLRRRYGNAG